MSARRFGARTVLLVIVVIAAGVFFYMRSQKAAGPSAMVGPPGGTASGVASGGGPVSVTTVLAVTRDYDVTLDASGTVASLNSVDIHPQISAAITKVHVKEGQFVKAGDVLFTLDNRSDQVAVARAQADLQKAQASLVDAQRQLSRSKDLLAQHFVSQSAVDTNQSLVDAQVATVAASRAAVDAARVNLGYSRIVAPGAGRIGAINVYAGSYVQPGTTTLVNITQLDPIAVSFSLPQRNLNDALDSLRRGSGAVTAQLPEGRGKLVGKLQFVNSSVDPSSGGVVVKAVFDNRDELLWPGAYVNVSLRVQTIKDAIVVPQASIIQGALGRTVYVMDADHKVALKKVEVLYSAGTDAVVKGVDAGMKVVVDGRTQLRPGQRVTEAAPGSTGNGASRPRSKPAEGADAPRAASGPADGPGALP